jgi:hypothetical protein
MNQSLLFMRIHVFQCERAAQATGYAKNGKTGRYGLSTQKAKRLLVLMSCYEIITIWMGFFWILGWSAFR